MKGGPGFVAGKIYRWHDSALNSRKDRDHLAVTIVGPGEPTAHPLQCCRQDPVPERRADAQRAQLAGQDRPVSGS
jgi:hypothetical protein